MLAFLTHVTQNYFISKKNHNCFKQICHTTSYNLRWTPLSRPIYGQSKLSVKASLKGYCSLRTTLLYVPHLLPCRLMDSAAPSHGRRLWVCDTPTPDGAARRCKTQSSALTLAVPP